MAKCIEQDFCLPCQGMASVLTPSYVLQLTADLAAFCVPGEQLCLGDTRWHADKNGDLFCVIVMLRKMTIDILSLSFLSMLTSF